MKDGSNKGLDLDLKKVRAMRTWARAQEGGSHERCDQ